MIHIIWVVRSNMQLEQLPTCHSVNLCVFILASFPGPPWYAHLLYAQPLNPLACFSMPVGSRSCTLGRRGLGNKAMFLRVPFNSDVCHRNVYKSVVTELKSEKLHYVSCPVFLCQRIRN